MFLWQILKSGSYSGSEDVTTPRKRMTISGKGGGKLTCSGREEGELSPAQEEKEEGEGSPQYVLGPDCDKKRIGLVW